jgi:hypothetical protein
LQNLPSLGLPAILRLQVRRFRCTQPGCPQRTLTETITPLAQRWAHRTDRLRGSLHRFAMMLAGEAGARLAGRIGMPSSGTTLLRLLREQPPERPVSDRLGIDDWTLRRGERYGTLIVDLVCHRPVDVLIDRTAETVTAWLQAHPGVTLIARETCLHRRHHVVATPARIKMARIIEPLAGARSRHIGATSPNRRLIRRPEGTPNYCPLQRVSTPLRFFSEPVVHQPRIRPWR